MTELSYEQDQALTAIAARIMNGYCPCHMKVGRVVLHPKGYKVKVISGCFRDRTYGRISNWWTWRRVRKDGTLGREQSGYGWCPDWRMITIKNT